MMYRALIAAAAVLACAPFAMSADQKPAVQYRIDREGGGETWMSSEPVYSTSYDRDWRDDRGTRSDVRWQDRDLRGREGEGRWQDREGRWHQGDVNTRRDADMRSNEMRDQSMDCNVSRAERESGRGEFRDANREKDANVKIDTQKNDVNIRTDKRSDAGMRMDADRGNVSLDRKQSFNSDRVAPNFQAQHAADHIAKPTADVSFINEKDLKDVDLNQCTFDFTPEPQAMPRQSLDTGMRNEPQNMKYERDAKFIEAPTMQGESSNWRESQGTKPAVQYRINRER